ncbi:polyprenyl synthetase family protein [Priestia aryabhattai]|uniref:polyprenyl synthetase family protein n=1 Tax=Priestia aryabhattai TaxID=412384 RepID=UPI003D28275B
MKENGRFYIQQFLLKYFDESDLEVEMQKYILELLHKKGKIFSDIESTFTWGEFSFNVCSLLNTDQTLTEKIGIASAIELLILSSDIIDDLVDYDQKGIFRKILPDSKALTLSNALLMESFHLLVAYSRSEAVNNLSVVIRCLKTACIGQWRDLSFIAGNINANEEIYFQLVKQKSVSFIQLIFGLNEVKKDPILENISTYIGFSGQLKNDARDILSASSNDLKQQKATLPLIKAIEYSIEKDNGLLLRKLKELECDQFNQQLICEIQTYIMKTGSIDYCLVLAKFYINQAKSLLNQRFPHKKVYTKQLIQLLD